MPTINKRGIDTIMSLKKKIAAAFIACAMTLAVVPSAFACTALYVGSDLTEDGTTMFGRIEDLGTNDYNKLFNISPAGKHTAGEVYEGCYGFTHTFTHDSYRYTARRDDNGLGVCPDCDSTHEHTPYEEAGTNEKGVMVSATESLYGTDAVLSVDPYVDNGIEEAEITTVLLSEASTAREGVALLTSIYDNAGAAGGSGVFIADQNETWFVENLTGHTYLALKLSSSVVFMQPNVAAMGKIDLDDTDHVVASANLISVAQKAGTFVGDAAANVIDLDASYNGDIASDRMAAGLNYLYGTDTFTKDNYSETDFAISNVGENGAIVPVYSNIQLTKKFSVEDSIHFFQTEPIGKTGNVETHLFQVSATGDLNTAITEWTAFALSYRTNGRRLQGAVTHKTPPASCHGNRGRCGFMGNASGAAKPQCSRELTHARAAVLAWSLLYIFRVVLYTFWLMALLALVAAACLASSVSAAATAAFISA